MTFSTLASPGVSLQGGGGSGGGGGGTPGGSNTQIQYNSSGTFAGASGLTTNGTELTIASGTKTADAPVLNMSQTWNNAAVTFTGLKFNATATAAATLSMLQDLQVGGAPTFSFGFSSANGGSPTIWLGQSAPSVTNYALKNFSGQIYLNAQNSAFVGIGVNNQVTAQVEATRVILTQTTQLAWGQSGISTPDLFLTRRGTANLRLGAADAAAPVAQTLSVQSVVAGTSNTAGANLTITGSQGTGTGAGGSIIFQVAPAGSSGTAQNALATALTIDSNRKATFVGEIQLGSGGSSTLGDNANYSFVGVSNLLYLGANGFVFRTFANANATVVVPDAANTLALRNGTNAQTFNVYNTFTSSTNFERFRIFAQSAAAVLIGTEKGSGGGTARALALQTDATSRLTLDTVGSAQIVTALTVATLPATPLTGMIARVTDALAPAVGVTVAAGGAAQALCWYNGANWTVIGV